MRASDALRLSAAAVLTEFDTGLINPVNPPYTYLDLRTTLDACEAVGHGWAGWDYSALFQGDGTGKTVYVPTVRELARPVALALAGYGSTSNFTHAPATGAASWVLRYTHVAATAARAPTEIFLSTGLWWDAATLAVNVTSVPAGAVTFALEPHAGTVSLPSVNATRADATAPFAYTTLRVFSAAGATGEAAVTVSVSGRG